MERNRTLGDPRASVDRIVKAINARDLEGFLACFHTAYRSEQPLHPERNFVGVDRVRANWEHNLAAMDDLRWDLLSTVVQGDHIAAELRWSGTRSSGERWTEQGVIIYTVRDGLIVAGRLYLGPSA